MTTAKNARPDEVPCRRCQARGAPTSVLLRKTASAYTVVRAVRLMQAHDLLPGHQGLEAGGKHVHHFVWGLLLLLTQLGMLRLGACLHRPLRANVACMGVVLVLDEFDILAGKQGTTQSAAVRAALDCAGVAGALAGLQSWRSTWAD